MAGYIGSKSSVTLVDGYSEAEADAEFVNDPSGAITVSGSNVGIGTSSPSRVLHTSGDVVRFDNAGTSAILLLDTTNNEGFRLVTNRTSGAFSIEDMGTATSGAGTERMVIDSAGNVGIGVVPAAWSSTRPVLQIGTQSSLSSFNTDGRTIVSTNAYHDSVSNRWEYITNDHATQYEQYQGNHRFQIASSGTANNPITWTNALQIDTSGKVGIGETSPDAKLHIRDATDGGSSSTTSAIQFSRRNGGANDASIKMQHDGSDGVSNLQFHFGTSERMRIDSSGKLLVGGTSQADSTSVTLNPQGYIYAKSSHQQAGIFDRDNSPGDILIFRKNGTAVGSIGTTGDDFYITKSGTNQTGIYFNELGMLPMKSGSITDNTRDIGQSGYRWDDIYATNGTIQTSDFNEKQDIVSLTATEMLVGKRISALFKTFRWKDSVADKGDNARTHTGVIAQDVQAAFTAEGLDAGDYALFISTTWWEHDVDVPAVEAVEAVDAVTETTTDEDGNEVVTVITEAVEAVEAKDAYTRTDTYDTEDEAPEGATSKTRLGIRYPELLSFVAAYNEQRFVSIEARLTALEA